LAEISGISPEEFFNETHHRREKSAVIGTRPKEKLLADTLTVKK